MKKESVPMPRTLSAGHLPAGTARRPAGQRGQLLVVFALTLIAMIGMVGLIIDGGDTFLQRRDAQNVADAAAMAAGYAYANGVDPTTAAQTTAASNGYTNGVGGTVVSVTTDDSSIAVTVTRPHRNYFAGILGFVSWNVSATASVRAGLPNAAIGALPIIFNQKAVQDIANKTPNTPATFDEPAVGSNDIPLTDSAFNWTTFCTANGTPCNGDSTTVDNLINQNGVSTTVTTDEQIGPLNAGSHTTLYSDLALHVGSAYPVAIVDDSGAMIGWSYFHLTGSVGGSTKQISGWFDDKVNPAPLKVVQGGGPAGNFGAYSVDLIN
jgi:Flp pilus assembly protein TadG